MEVQLVDAVLFLLAAKLMLNKMTLSLIALTFHCEITYVCTLESLFGPFWIIVQIWCSGRLYSAFILLLSTYLLLFSPLLCFATQL